MRGHGGGTRRRRSWLRWGLFLAIVGLLVFGVYRLTAGPGIAPNTVLVVDLRQEIAERSSGDLLELLGPPSLDVTSLRRLLSSAAGDPRVSGVLLRTSRAPCGLGRVEEVRELVAEFRSSGKPVIAYAEAADSLGYLLAASAERIFLDQSAYLELTGFRLSAFFFRDLLSRWGIEFDLVRVGDFKGVFEQLRASEPSELFNEAMNSLADSLYATLIADVASSRDLGDLAESLVEGLIDRAPLSPEMAQKKDLVDEVIHRAELRDHLERQFGADMVLTAASTYLGALGGTTAPGRRIAVVQVVGVIAEGETRYVPLLGGACGAETVVKALEEAAQDPDIAGVLLRVDSQGGEASAAVKIWNQVRLTRERKPVVASFGDAAASGGYYVACEADAIVAHRGTLTGSIGVFGGKVVIDKLLEEQGVRVESYLRGRRAGLYDPTRNFSPEERGAMEEQLESIYRDFVSRVADGRKKTPEEIDRVARGRVWTGEQARVRGLVDALGGMSVALDKLRELADISPGESLELVPLPPAPSVWDVLVGERREELVRSARARAAGNDWRWIADAALRGSAILEGRSGLALMPFRLEMR